MKLLSTEELQTYIEKEYSKLKDIAVKDNIYRELNINFTDRIIYDGTYVYTGEYGYHYVEQERGKIYVHRSSDELLEVGYWFFDIITFNLALNYEHEHRIEGKDSRRMLFTKQSELLGAIGDYYSKRKEIDIELVLKERPYKDKF